MIIETKDGKRIDLDAARKRLAEIETLYRQEHNVSKRCERYEEWCDEYAEPILDALDAALSVLITVGPQRTESAIAYDNGLRDGITMVRHAARMVSES